VLMLTLGNWSDVLHMLIAFLGEAVCLMPSQDLLQAVLKVYVDQIITFTLLYLSKNMYVLILIIEMTRWLMSRNLLELISQEERETSLRNDEDKSNHKTRTRQRLSDGS